MRFMLANPHAAGLCHLSPGHGTERVPEDVLADLPSLAGPRLLVEAEVDAAVDAGVVDVVGDLVPGGVVAGRCPAPRDWSG